MHEAGTRIALAMAGARGRIDAHGDDEALVVFRLEPDCDSPITTLVFCDGLAVLSAPMGEAFVEADVLVGTA